MNGAGRTHSYIRAVSMKLAHEGSRRMVLKLISLADRPFGSIVILIGLSATLQAQRPSQISAYSLSSSPLSLSFCEQPSADCLPNSTAVSPQQSSGQNDASGSSSYKNDWVHSWLRKVDQVRANQPHFVSPVVTTHVLLVQQFRYDMSWQQDPSGGTVTSNYGASRGLEIIPTTRLEVGLFLPAYLVHQSKTPDGFGDFSWQVKFRALSASEGKGDYFVGFFLGGSFPTGATPNGLGHTVLSPTFAAAKGLGAVDIQSTIGANLPTSGANILGRSIIFNTAVNYRIKGKIWPMIEQNSTFWSGGTLDGKKQVFLTPGLVLGSFPLAERLHLTVGGGLQIAVTRFHQDDHRWILSVRFPF
jgi:hypothetical protein